MPDHLILPAPVSLASRRANSGFGEAPKRAPGQHGKKLREDLDQAIAALPQAAPADGVDPSHVFKIRAVGRLQDSALESSGLQLLGDTTKWTYFVLAPGHDPTRFKKSLSAYTAAGGGASLVPGKTLFDAIDEILPYGREDRHGPGLPSDGEPIDGHLVVDVIVWPSPDFDTASSRVDDVRAAIKRHPDAGVLAVDNRPRFTVVRARVDRGALDDLLDLPAVERIRVPPTPRLEPSTWRHVDIGDLPAPTVVAAAPMGLIDDEVMEHPLLPSSVVASRTAIPANYQWGPPSDHGTLVAGLYAYGDIEDALAGDSGWIARAPIHAVRVLEPHPDGSGRTRFPSDRPAHLVIEDAIRHLHKAHQVRVFNLSITDDAAYSGPHVSVWTERLDDLVRELNIVIVVAAGNHRRDDLPPRSEILAAYPRYLLDDAARIAEPAVASNVLTVGSVTHADAPQKIDGTSPPGDRPIARAGQPSPFTRTGPGAAASIKPDLVERGGNWVVDTIDLIRDKDAGVGVISLRNRDGQLFGVTSGTSFAAPRVARLAAGVLHRYPGASANLVRALVGAAVTPVANPANLEAKELRRMAGHGRPLPMRALESGPRRVAMTFDGSMAADTAVIHPVPIPADFARGNSARTIVVALAFDPEVRRTRREYLAGRMTFDLVRSMSIEEIEAIWKKQPDDRSLRLDLPNDRRRRPTLEPGAQESTTSTLQVRSLRRKRLLPDDGDTYYVVVRHTSSPWAGGKEQRYALVVALDDEERQGIDLYASLAARLTAAVRVRV